MHHRQAAVEFLLRLWRARGLEVHLAQSLGPDCCGKGARQQRYDECSQVRFHGGCLVVSIRSPPRARALRMLSKRPAQRAVGFRSVRCLPTAFPLPSASNGDLGTSRPEEQLSIKITRCWTRPKEGSCQAEPSNPRRFICGFRSPPRKRTSLVL